MAILTWCHQANALIQIGLSQFQRITPEKLPYSHQARASQSRSPPPSSTSPASSAAAANLAVFSCQPVARPIPPQPPENIRQINFSSLPINSAISPYLVQWQ